MDYEKRRVRDDLKSFGLSIRKNRLSFTEMRRDNRTEALKSESMKTINYRPC